MIKPKKKLQFFPLFRSLKGYSWVKLKADIDSGLNVALLDFPQAMTYALLAGFPVMFGVYASAIGAIVGPFFASSRHVILGTTNATAVLVLSSFLTLDLPDSQKLIALPVLVLLVGLFMVIGAFLRLAAFIKYISQTVIIGYITAAAFLIVVNQVDTILGIPETQAATFFEVLSRDILSLDLVHWQSVVIAGLTCFVYLSINRYIKIISRVALTLVIVSFIAFIASYLGVDLEMLEATTFGSWPFKFPDINFELINLMGPPALGVAFLAILESASIAKTIAAKSGKTVDLNQHMLSVGASNIASAFGSGMPISGSLTRSILNWTSGAQTVLSSIFNGLFLIFGVLTLGPLIVFVPKACLSMVVVFVGFSLINIEHIKIVIRSTKADATVFFITFIGGLLFPLNMAIGLGAAASIILFLRKVSEPHLVQYAFNQEGELLEQDIEEASNIPEISIVHIEGELFFGSTDIFLEQIRLICSSKNLKVIILRMRNAHYIDASSAFAIADLICFARQRGRHFIVTGANEDVERIFRKGGVMPLLGESNFFHHTPQNPNLAMRHALKRAQELIGEEKARILLFTSPDGDGGETVLAKEEV